MNHLATLSCRAIFGVLVLSLLVFPATARAAANKTTTRPITDLLSTQGTFCVDDGSGGCFLFVPPDPNFLGWSEDLDRDNNGVLDHSSLFAGIDYAGLANAYPGGNGPQMTGTITERPLKDGRAEVTVILHTKNANAWIIELSLDDLNGDTLGAIAGKPTLLGHRPVDVLAGGSQALADSVLHVTFINSAPGAPLPDLLQLLNFPDTLPGTEVKFVSFKAEVKGAFTAEYGVPEGTPGACSVVQTGLFMASGQPMQGEFADDFPTEFIKCRTTGSASTHPQSAVSDLSISGESAPRQSHAQLFVPFVGN
jgi:hypothetical protein